MFHKMVDGTKNINFKHNNFTLKLAIKLNHNLLRSKSDGRILEDGLATKIYIEKICKIILKNSELLSLLTMAK